MYSNKFCEEDRPNKYLANKMNEFILYGAGVRGKNVLNFLKFMDLDNVVAFCQTTIDKEVDIKGKPVISYNEAKKMNLPIVISVSDKYHSDIEKN